MFILQLSKFSPRTKRTRADTEIKLVPFFPLLCYRDVSIDSSIYISTKQGNAYQQELNKLQEKYGHIELILMLLKSILLYIC